MVNNILVPLTLAAAFAVSPCSASEADVKNSVNEFLAALHDLDLPRMQNCFADDVSVFYHGGDILLRIDSKEELRNAHAQTVAFIRDAVAKEGRTKPPYHDVGARDVRVQMLSDNAAVATFLMPNPTFVRRSSVVYTKREGRRKIVHMHTSTRNRPK